MCDKILNQVAEQHGVSVDEVREKIKEAIDIAYAKNGKGFDVPCKGRKPTVDEIIVYLAAEVKKSVEGSR
jgi:hypothetical protein